MSIRKSVMTGTLTAVIAAPLSFLVAPAQADDAGAFVGGMLTSRVLGNMRARTRAEQEQAYYAQQQAQQQAQPVQQAPATPTQKTTQQKLEELDKLAAGGYITPEEYKAKKQQIIDNM